MKSFNTFRSELLTEESTEISTAMEAVLGVAYDAACKTSTRNQKLTLKAGMKANSTAFKKTSTYWKKGTEEKQIENLETEKIFYKSFDSNLMLLIFSN